MTHDFEYSTRRGGRLAGAALVAGLMIVAVAMAKPLPVGVWLVLLPCMLVCIWQVSINPIYGMRLSRRVLHIFEGRKDHSFPVRDIAYLKIIESGRFTRFRLVLTDGTEAPIAAQALPDALVLIREATSRGIPVRHG